MIAKDFVTEWRKIAPSVRDLQVEMDPVCLPEAPGGTNLGNDTSAEVRPNRNLPVAVHLRDEWPLVTSCHALDPFQSSDQRFRDLITTKVVRRENEYPNLELLNSPPLNLSIPDLSIMGQDDPVL